jgi:bisphosphoglycerate-independent phosphoglycerate mutase (AlkP superfamily)
MSDATNGDNKSRLDRVEQLLEVLVNEHIQFHEEHRQVLKAQVTLYDTTQKLAEALAQSQTATNAKFAELAAAQKHTDENLAALINVVDNLVRRPPPPA